METEKFNKTLIETIDSIKAYINLRTELVSLIFIEKASKIFSSVFMLIIFLQLLFFALLFLSLAFAAWFNSVTDSLYTGYLILAGFYLLIGFIIYISRKRFFVDPMIKGFTETLYEEEDDFLNPDKQKKQSHEEN
jgi:hypothetical protein